jgi:hypothetical protein
MIDQLQPMSHPLYSGTATAADQKTHRDLPYTEPKNERQTLDVMLSS